MQHRWWYSLPSVVRHSVFSTLMLIVITVATVCGSRFVEIASSQLKSKFEVRVLEFLVYAVTVSDAYYMLVQLVGPVVEKLRSARR